jgi:hypothetical protein
MLGMAWRVSFTMYSRGTGGGERERERERRDGSVPVQWIVLPGGREGGRARERERERERGHLRGHRGSRHQFFCFYRRARPTLQPQHRVGTLWPVTPICRYFFLTSCVLSFLICVLAVSFLPICCILSVFVYIYVCIGIFFALSHKLSLHAFSLVVEP